MLVTASRWINPYPLVQTPDGGFSNAWLDRAWTVAFIAPLVSIILALFGRGWSRIMLALSGGLTLLLAFGSLLQKEPDALPYFPPDLHTIKDVRKWRP